MSAVELVKSALEVINEEGGRALLERYEEFFTNDFDFRPAMTGSIDGRTYRGRDGFAEYWNDFYESQDVSFLFELRDKRMARATSYLTQAEGRKAADATA